MVLLVIAGNSIAEFEYPKSWPCEPSSRHASTTEYVTSGTTKVTAYTVIIADSRRVRRVIGSGGPSSKASMEFDGGVISTNGQVVTVAGSGLRGPRDGARTATFDEPSGLWCRTTATSTCRTAGAVAFEGPRHRSEQ